MDIQKPERTFSLEFIGFRVYFEPWTNMECPKTGATNTAGRDAHPHEGCPLQLNLLELMKPMYPISLCTLSASETLARVTLGGVVSTIIASELQFQGSSPRLEIPPSTLNSMV